MEHTAGFRIGHGKNDGAERVREDEKDLYPVSVSKPPEVEVPVRLT